MKVTKEEFEAYEKVRRSGKYNMMTQADWAASAANLEYERYIEVLKNYDQCVKKWPEVRS